MTDNFNLFAVTFDCSDSLVSKSIWNAFDIDGVPQMFHNLDDAKLWVMGLLDNVIFVDDDTIQKSADMFHDSDLGDDINIFGCGAGALVPWLSVADFDGVIVNFWIHKIIIH